MKKRTKRIIKEKIITTLQFICIMTVLLGGLCLCGHIETHYNREGKIIKIEENKTIIVEDKCGYIWTFEGTGFNVGDNVVIKMDNNCTDSIITDDIILDVLKK